MQANQVYPGSAVTDDGSTSLLKKSAPILLCAIFLAVQFSSQQISNIHIYNILVIASGFTAVLYWHKFHFVPSIGITIVLCSMLISTIWLVSQSVSWKVNASCVTVFAVFWAAGVLSRTMSTKKLNLLLKCCCLTAFAVTAFQAVVHFGNITSSGTDHPDFGWAMYGTTLPGQCVYLALWTFMFLPLKSKSKYRYIPFYIIFGLNSLIASLFNVRLMVLALILAAIMPWFLFDKLKILYLRSGALLSLLILTILGTSLLFSLGTVKPYTTKTLADRMESIVEDEGSGRVGLYKMGIEKLTEKNFASLLLGDGGMYTVNLTNGRDMHNIYLETLHSLGLLGLAGLIMIVVSITYREWNNRFQYPLGATLVAYFIVGFIMFGFREPMIWFLLGTYDANRYEKTR